MLFSGGQVIHSVNGSKGCVAFSMSYDKEKSKLYFYGIFRQNPCKYYIKNANNISTFFDNLFELFPG